MPTSKHIKILSVRLPEPEIRRIKSLAASRGVTVQEAVHQALESWALAAPNAVPESLAALHGSLSGVDVFGIRGREKKAELARDRRRLQ
jgi:hypothetical protein